MNTTDKTVLGAAPKRSNPMSMLMFALLLGSAPVIAASDAQQEPAAEAGGKGDSAKHQVRTPIASPVKPKKRAPLPDDPQSKALIERAVARRQAIITGDLDKAYEYASPQYRAVFNQGDYFKRQSMQLRRTGAGVDAIKYLNDEKTAAKVLVRIHYIVYLESGAPLNDSGASWESWKLIDGQWWHVPD